ncbi:MAG: hypothetical protein K1X64_04840 [Myxococcaceae bacterium]|nr:hypothetical protein [Myxococcaceae bacterium]
MGRQSQQRFALLLFATLLAVFSAQSSAQSRAEIVWYRDGGAPTVVPAEPLTVGQVRSSARLDAGAQAAEQRPSDAGSPNNNPDASVAAPSREMGVWCGYFIRGGIRRSYCSPLNLKDAQAECDKKVSIEFGFKTECSCTDDKAFLGDRCKGPDAGEPQDDTRLLNP